MTDHEGNVYIIEDRSGGVDDDIWFANDINQAIRRPHRFHQPCQEHPFRR